jgi:hypothetical protein
MDEPFARLSTKGARMLEDGFAAMRKKKYGEARELFHTLAVAYPDNTSVRFQELRAAVREEDFEAVPALWRSLLARDYVGYADRLETSKEMADLRKSPSFREVQAIKAEMKGKYSAGLGKGFVFVARTRPYQSPKYDGETGAAKLELSQDAFHYDPATRRFKRLSDSGQVVAIHRDGGKLMLLQAKALKKVNGGTAFSKPEATLVSLDTLEKTGSLAIDGDAHSVSLCFSSKGEPVWASSGPAADKSLTLDATATALVPVEEGCGPAVATTIAHPVRIEHRRPAPEGVALSDDGLQMTGVDADKPVRASQSIRPGSLTWSPGKKRFAYTGVGDRCAAAGKEEKPAPNALYVWAADPKKATRLVATAAQYELQWLDDDHLAYESRSEGTAKLTVHDFTAGGAPLTLKTPSGVGLYGLPTVGCGDAQLQAMAQ